MYWPAFILGLFGSLHCAVMCAPIMATLPWKGITSLNIASKKAIYQIGRISSYKIIGLIFYALGRAFFPAELQTGISIAIGVLLVLYALSRLLKLDKSSPWGMILFNAISKAFGPLMQSKSVISRYFMGMVNGFLPCGMVYIAAFTAITMSSMQEAVTYMAVFGLGTLPLLTVVLGSINLIRKKTGFSFNRISPYFLAVLGCYFVLRGMELGIPYISPILEVTAGSDPALCAP